MLRCIVGWRQYVTDLLQYRRDMRVRDTHVVFPFQENYYVSPSRPSLIDKWLTLIRLTSIVCGEVNVVILYVYYTFLQTLLRHVFTCPTCPHVTVPRRTPRENFERISPTINLPIRTICRAICTESYVFAMRLSSAWETRRKRATAIRRSL